MSEAKIEEMLNSYSWIKVPKHTYCGDLSVEENYSDLNKHHIEETKFLINKCRELGEYIKHNNVLI